MSANALRTFCFLILSASFCVTAGAEPASKTKLAVMNLKALSGLSPQVALMLTEMMTTEISKIDTFEVINRDDMQTMLAHIADKQLLGCDDTKCLVKIGGALGVEYLVSGNMGKVGDRFVINLKLITIDDASVKNRVVNKNAKTEGQLLSNIEKSVYELFGSKRTSLYVEEDGGDLFVAADKAGATVTVDGVPVDGVTPLTLENIAAGLHLVEIQKGGLYGKKQITMVPNGLVKVNLTLKKEQGFMKIFSGPAGAVVTVDGVNKGTTPVLVENIASGRRTVTLKKNDYMDTTFTAAVTQGEVEKISIDMVPAAYLAVTAKPRKAVVRVNGVPVDFEKTPEVKVPAGPAEVTVTAANYDTVAQTLTLKAGEHKKLNAELKYRYAVLSVTTIPESADVYLEFKRIGMTNYYNKLMTPGEYLLRLTKTGYKDIDKKLKLERGKKENLSFTLEHTVAYLDSVSDARAAFTRKRQKIQKIVFSAASVVLGGVALYHELGARNDLDEQDRIAGEYNDGVYGADFVGYKRNYDAAGQSADDHMSARNLCLIWSGVSAGVFGLAFVF